MCSLIAFVIFLSGCAKVSHLQELLTLKTYSDNQGLQDQYVQEQDEKFAKLLGAIKEKRIQDYPSKKSFLKNFGDPIFTKVVNKNNQNVEQWLYRYAQKYFNSPKVYAYFDSSGQLIDWSLEEPIQKE
ncbi:MAG: hypothetical protein ABIJ41_00560 [Candidatus Omnitrophota bacterium]